MHILVAPDSFKGSLSSLEASRIIARGLEAGGIDDVHLIPIADGGEGTVESLCIATRGTVYLTTVRGPLGEDVVAKWGILGDGQTAVIELASASGLMLTPAGQRKPLLASTFGTGELIRTALSNNCKRIIIGLGGSATTDGGAGIAQALGAILVDGQGKPLSFGGGPLIDLAHIDITPLKSLLSNVELLVACDVNNPLCGENGSAWVYGPQKGATAEEIQLLDRALSHYADIIEQEIGIDVRSMPGSGAAGGAGAGLVALLSAKLVSGFQLIVSETGLEQHISRADLIITGEGCTDKFTTFGKVPMGIAAIAKKYGIPVICLSGCLQNGWKELYAHGITACISISDGAITLDDAIGRAEPLLHNAAEAIGRILRATTHEKGRL